MASVPDVAQLGSVFNVEYPFRAVSGIGTSALR